MVKNCEECDQLVVTSHNPNVHPYMCKQKERRIDAPWKRPKWCPLLEANIITGKRKRRIPRYEKTQTIEMESRFMRDLPFSKLGGYLQGLSGRTQKQTTFSINKMIKLTKIRIQEGG